MKNNVNSNNSRRNLYQEVTNKMLAALAEGVAPWRKPWADNVYLSHRNGKEYSYGLLRRAIG